MVHGLRRPPADRRDVDGCRGEREPLKARASNGEAVLGDQPMAGPEGVIERAAPARTDGIVAVVRQAVAGRHQAEKHLEPACGLAQATPDARA